MINPYSALCYYKLFANYLNADSIITNAGVPGLIINNNKGIRYFKTLPGFTVGRWDQSRFEKFADQQRIKGSFIQTRTNEHEAPRPVTNVSHLYKTQYRTNFCIYRHHFEDLSWCGKMRKDTLRTYKQIVKGGVTSEKTSAGPDLITFFKWYSANHAQKKMSPMYTLNLESLGELLTYQNWTLVKTTLDGEPVGFIFGAIYADEFDQVFLSTNPTIKQAARLTILSTINLILTKQNKYLMGGGIRENDSLHDFKESLGMFQERHITIKHITTDHPDFKNSSQLLSDYWPPNS